MEESVLVLGARRYARFREVPEYARPFQFPWFGVCAVLIVVPAFTYLARLASRFGEEGNVKAIQAIAGLVMLVVFLVPLFALWYAAKTRKGSPVPKALPLRPDDQDWQLVVVRVRLMEKLGYRDMGWLGITQDEVIFHGRRFDFNITASDWDKAYQSEGCPTLKIPKCKPIGQVLIRFVSLGTRDGVVFPSKEIDNRLLSALARVVRSNRPTILPPIEYPLKPLRMQSLLLAALAGFLVGVGVDILSLQVPSHTGHRDIGFYIGMPLLTGLTGALLASADWLAGRSWNRQVDRWRLKFGTRL